MDIISSRSNSKIKEARALHRRKARRESGLYLVEGINHVGGALDAGKEVSAIFYSVDLLDSEYALNVIEGARLKNVACYNTTPQVFSSLATRENPQGILAVVQQSHQELSSIRPENFQWGVALVAPQDPGNVGAVLRTIDAVAADGLLLLEGGVDPYHPSAVRASMGSLFWQPVISCSVRSFAEWASDNEYTIFGTSAHGEVDFHRIVHYKRPCILLMGSEREGLSAEQVRMCDQVVKIPMHGQANSLNLAVAAGIMLYDMLDKQ